MALQTSLQVTGLMLEANGLTCGSLKQYRGQTATMTPTKGTKHMNDMGPTYDRLQNSPYFCVFKYARAVKQKVWNEAENRERVLSPHTLYGRVRLARFARVRLLLHALPISLLILKKKTDCFAVYTYE